MNTPKPCPLSDMGLPHPEHWWQSRDQEHNDRDRLDCKGLDKFLSDTTSSP